MKPWLKRCGGAERSGASLCGRGATDCAKLWLNYASEAALKLIEAPETVRADCPSCIYMYTCIYI